MERYKFLYEVSRKALDEELDRYKKLDEKAGRFLNILSITIVGYTALINAAYSKVFPLIQTSTSNLLFIALSIITFIGLFSAGARLFNSIRLKESPRLEIDHDVNTLVENEELITVYYQLALTCQDALSLARPILKEKTDVLESAYKEIRFSACVLCATLAVYFWILAKI
jgi:hypothetical protein